MAHNKIIDSVKKQGQVAIKDLDEFLRFVINESDMRTYDDNYISILIPMKFDIDKVFGLDVCKRKPFWKKLYMSANRTLSASRSTFAARKRKAMVLR